jgi:hypothetical protein
MMASAGLPEQSAIISVIGRQFAMGADRAWKARTLALALGE